MATLLVVPGSGESEQRTTWTERPPLVHAKFGLVHKRHDYLA